MIVMIMVLLADKDERFWVRSLSTAKHRLQQTSEETAMPLEQNSSFVYWHIPPGDGCAFWSSCVESA